MPHRTLKGGDVRVKPALALVASACTDREFCRMIVLYFVCFVVAVRMRRLVSDSDRGQW